MNTLHYIFDPLCGWCYGAAPLIAAARTLPGLKLALHGGGMLAGAQRLRITEQWREYVRVHDARIARLTGQTFGAAYADGLLRDTSAVLDSAPPTTAILASEEIAERGLDMLHRLQRAHYVEGRRIADKAEILALAGELGLAGDAFAAAFERLSGAATAAHFSDSRSWLARLGAQGFPSFALERADGTLERIEASRFYGDVAAWTHYLAERAPGYEADPGEQGQSCGLDGCAI